MPVKLVYEIPFDRGMLPPPSAARSGGLAAALNALALGTTSNTVLGCTDCDYKCCSANQLCRHMYNTKHGLTKCPECGTYLVARAFQAGLKKLVERSRDHSSSTASAHRKALESSGSFLSSPGGPGSETSAVQEPFAVDTVSHVHVSTNPGIHVKEKKDFVLPGLPADYGLTPVVKTDAVSMRTVTAARLTASNALGIVDKELEDRTFRCTQCLTTVATWTQLTKHIDQTEHTLPRCGQCAKTLKCYGPLRPMRHEEVSKHRGLLGIYNTRADYTLSNQDQDKMYNATNHFTGLSVLQYRCVCGLSFLHVVQIAEHLRRVHRVTMIEDRAQCLTCGVELDLASMTEHLRGDVFHPVDLPPSALTLGSAPSPTSTTGKGDPSSPSVSTVTVDGGPAPHTIIVPGFVASPFLIFRPLLPSYKLERRLGSPSVVHIPTYIVMYQCPECVTMFTTWDLIVQHINVTGHCKVYCVDCHDFIPTLSGYLTGSTEPSIPSRLVAASATGGASGPNSGPGTVPALSGIGGHGGVGGIPPYTLEPRPRSAVTNVVEFLAHMQQHSNIIGFPVSPETLEVLLDVNQTISDEVVNPEPNSKLLVGDDGEQTVAGYQCPLDVCSAAFLYYGDLIDHFLSSGHGRAPSEDPNEFRLQSSLPMVSFRARFSVSMLINEFGFLRCPHCFRVFPENRVQMHQFFCIPYHQAMGRKAAATSTSASTSGSPYPDTMANLSLSA